MYLSLIAGRCTEVRGGGVNEWIDEVSGRRDWFVTWLSCANLEAARLQKPLAIEDTVIHMLSDPETADKEPGGNALPPDSSRLCKSIYRTGESIIAPILKRSSLCSKTLWVCVKMGEKWSMIQTLQPGDSGMEICSSQPIYGLRNTHHPTGCSFFSTTES